MPACAGMTSARRCAGMTINCAGLRRHDERPSPRRKPGPTRSTQGDFTSGCRPSPAWRWTVPAFAGMTSARRPGESRGPRIPPKVTSPLDAGLRRHDDGLCRPSLAWRWTVPACAGMTSARRPGESRAPRIPPKVSSPLDAGLRRHDDGPCRPSLAW